ETNVERKISSMSLKIALGDIDYSLKLQLFEQALAEADTLLLSEPRNENLIQLLRKLHSRISFHFRTLGKSAQKEGNSESARNWFLQSLKHSERTVYYVQSNLELMTDKRWIFDAHLNYTEDLSRLGRIEEAIENLEIAGKTLQDIKKNNADDREIVIFEIWYLCVKQAILKQQGIPEAALAVAKTGLNLALERTESDPTNIEPIYWTLELANAAANLASELKREPQAESYWLICRKYEKQYKERFGGDFSYVF
ncbi:MAG: hypothetical protein M3367_13970, partial [Acidobacteriota bacterium]|nr:hypothetical protein [Acidobacteriota bacterium]